MTLTSSAEAPTVSGAGCPTCQFTLWTPIASLRVSTAGLYDDARFPGRCLLSLHEHYEDLCALPAGLLADYMRDLADLSTALRAVTGSARVNYAVLGNQEAHVHWHVVPRHPEQEPLPRHSPWDDPRRRATLGEAQTRVLVADLREQLVERRSIARAPG